MFSIYGYCSAKGRMTAFGLVAILITLLSFPLLMNVGRGCGAKQVRVAIKVIDQQTHQPIDNATIEVDQAFAPPLVIRTNGGGSATFEGSFAINSRTTLFRHISHLYTGANSIRVSADGFTTIEKSIADFVEATWPTTTTAFAPIVVELIPDRQRPQKSPATVAGIHPAGR